MSCHSLGEKPFRQHMHNKRSHVERRTAPILASLTLPLLFTFSPVEPRPATHDTALKLFHPLLRARIAKAPLPPPHPSILCQFASSSCLSLFMSLLPLPSNPLQSLHSLSHSDRLIVFRPLSHGALGVEGSAAGACPVHTIKHAVHTDLGRPSHVHHLL